MVNSNTIGPKKRARCALGKRAHHGSREFWTRKTEFHSLPVRACAAGRIVVKRRPSRRWSICTRCSALACIVPGAQSGTCSFWDPRVQAKRARSRPLPDSVGDSRAVIKVIAEFQHSHEISKLIGSRRIIWGTAKHTRS